MKLSSFYDQLFLKKINKKPTMTKQILFNLVMDRVLKYAATTANSSMRVLDVGCGPGHFVNMLLKDGRFKVSAMDLTEEVIEQLKVKYPQVSFYQENISDSSRFSGQFDILTSIEVIEHVPDSDKDQFIRKCYEALKPGGVMIITTPNLERKHRIPVEYATTQPVEDWMTVDQAKSRFEKYFDEVEVATAVWYLPSVIGYAIFKRLTYPFHMGLEQRLLKNTRLGGHIVLTARKQEAK